MNLGCDDRIEEIWYYAGTNSENYDDGMVETILDMITEQ